MLSFCESMKLLELTFDFAHFYETLEIIIEQPNHSVQKLL